MRDAFCNCLRFSELLKGYEPRPRAERQEGDFDEHCSAVEPQFVDLAVTEAHFGSFWIGVWEQFAAAQRVERIRAKHEQLR